MTRGDVLSADWISFSSSLDKYLDFHCRALKHSEPPVSHHIRNYLKCAHLSFTSSFHIKTDVLSEQLQHSEKCVFSLQRSAASLMTAFIILTLWCVFIFVFTAAPSGEDEPVQTESVTWCSEDAVKHSDSPVSNRTASFSSFSTVIWFFLVSRLDARF